MTDRPNVVTRQAPHPPDLHRRNLRVAVPDAACGFMLVGQLPGSELTGSDSDGWAVVGSADGDLPGVLSTIQRWLRDEGIEQTDVRLGDHAHTMTRE